MCDGTLDPSFSGNGTLTTDFTPGFDGGWDIGLQTDGKIVVAGEASGQGGRFALARYQTDGMLAGGAGWDRPNPKFAVARYVGT
jgi:Domain of unknown function (DUF5122) beta-propeller